MHRNHLKSKKLKYQVSSSTYGTIRTRIHDKNSDIFFYNTVSKIVDRQPLSVSCTQFGPKGRAEIYDRVFSTNWREPMQIKVSVIW